MIVEKTWKTPDVLKLTQDEIKRHKVNVLQSPEHYLRNVGVDKRWRCSDCCQHKVLDAVMQHLTQHSLAQVFFHIFTSLSYCSTNIWVRAAQRRSKTRTSSYLLAKPRMFSSSPPPQRSQTTSKSQLPKCLTEAILLWINIKNRPQELDLKKINPAAPNFLSLLDVVLNFDMKCIFLNWNLSLNYLWTMNSFKKNNCFLITRINAVVFVSEFP